LRSIIPTCGQVSIASEEDGIGGMSKIFLWNSYFGISQNGCRVKTRKRKVLRKPSFLQQKGKILAYSYAICHCASHFDSANIGKSSLIFILFD